MIRSKPKLRLYTPKPHRVLNRKVIATDWKIYWNRDWRVIYRYTTGRYANSYMFKDGKDREIRFKTLNELNQDIT